MTDWQRGMYRLSKKPQRLDILRLQQRRIVEIDPGKAHARLYAVGQRWRASLPANVSFAWYTRIDKPTLHCTWRKRTFACSASNQSTVGMNFQTLRARSVVVLVDEYGTSSLCSTCDSELVPLRNIVPLRCDHKFSISDQSSLCQLLRYSGKGRDLCGYSAKSFKEFTRGNGAWMKMEHPWTGVQPVLTENVMLEESQVSKWITLTIIWIAVSESILWNGAFNVILL